MDNHSDIVTNQQGQVIAGASVLVTDTTGAVASIFSDDGVTPASNPLTTDGDGRFTFFAESGRYNLTVTATGFPSRTIRNVALFDPSEASESAFSPAGNIIATDVQAAIEEIGTDLASTVAGNGASLVGIEDSAGNFTATDVEGALAETLSDLASTASTSLGDGLVGGKRTGSGSVAFTGHDFHESRYIDAELDFGVVADSTDKATELNAAIAEAKARNVNTILLPEGDIGLGSEITDINTSGLKLISKGWAEGIHNIGSFVGTRFSPAGAFTGTLMTIAPVEGASNQGLQGIKVLGVSFNCAGTAAKGLVVKSTKYSEFDVSALNATDTGLEFDVVTTLGDGRGCQFNTIRYRSFQDVGGGVALRLKGDASANTSLNYFALVDIFHNDALAIVEENADNNLWGVVRTFRRATGAAPNSIEWQGGDTAAEACREEHFQLLTTNVAAIAKGTGTYTVGASKIQIDVIDKGNSTPTPTEETGTSIFHTEWRDFTPTVTSTTGTITTASGSVRYRRYSPTLVEIQVSATITTNGTGAGAVRITLPHAVGAGSLGARFTGEENGVSGKMVQGNVGAASSNLDVTFFDGTYPGADGATLLLTGFIETTITAVAS